MFVVICSSGSYDDYRSNPVAVASSKEVADAFAATRNAEIPRFNKVKQKYNSMWEKRQRTIMSKMTTPAPEAAPRYDSGKVSKEEQSKRDKVRKQIQDQIDAREKEYFELVTLYDKQFYEDNSITEENIEYFRTADSDTEYHVEEIKSLD